jgi:hypothetical protein
VIQLPLGTVEACSNDSSGSDPNQPLPQQQQQKMFGILFVSVGDSGIKMAWANSPKGDKSDENSPSNGMPNDTSGESCGKKEALPEDPENSPLMTAEVPATNKKSTNSSPAGSFLRRLFVEPREVGAGKRGREEPPAGAEEEEHGQVIRYLFDYLKH